MATGRVYVTHGAAGNSWIVLGDIIRLRFRMASEPWRTVDLPLCEASLRPLDEDTFVSGPHRVAECIGQLEFLLCNAPADVADALRSI